jgi:hypothetical protein
LLKGADPLKYDVKIMYELLLLAVVVLLIFFNVRREHFSLFGKELINISPFEETCRPDQEMDAGLCYTKCKTGYHGVGPGCWADTQDIGIGTVIGLEDCPKGWYTEGLLCREPVTGGGCSTYCDGNWNSNDGGFCHTRCDPIVGGRLKGRLDNGGICPGPQGGDKPDRVDGMCYGGCPKNLPKHLPGMPYLCYIGGDLSYTRGVGKIPSLARVVGKYTVF